jgi:hypothetical protein
MVLITSRVAFLSLVGSESKPVILLVGNDSMRSTMHFFHLSLRLLYLSCGIVGLYYPDSLLYETLNSLI